jgi:hypothetical protein
MAGGIGSGGNHKSAKHSLPAVAEWPKAPTRFTKEEAAEWDRIGAMIVRAGTVSAVDLLLVEDLAQVNARLVAAFSKADTKHTVISALTMIKGKILRELGMSPAGRRYVEALPTANEEGGVADPLKEFE